MTTNFDPALHPTAPNGRFVTRSAKPAGFTLNSPAATELEELPLVPPSGCAVCGEEPRSHHMRFGGGHVENPYYVEPSSEQRKERILASIGHQKAIRDGGGAAAGPEVELLHPSGCAICGGLQGSHGMTSRGGQGNHYFQDPSPAQRKERVTASIAVQRSQREARQGR